jgi:hypothetical protein
MEGRLMWKRRLGWVGGASALAVGAVPMPMGEMAGRLAWGEVDGAAFFPPFSDYALRLALLQPRLQP